MIDDLDHISFAEWLIALNACAVKAGYKTDEPFVQITGQLCWHSFYEAGVPPSVAINTAAMEGAEFGADYVL
jgi:hypothetical protein